MNPASGSHLLEAKIFKAGRDGTLWYYEAMLEALSLRLPANLNAALRRELAVLKGLGPRAW